MKSCTTGFLVLLFLVASILNASMPEWWADPETRILEDSEDPGEISENYAPLNLGQLKYVALQAQAHLNRNLPEGTEFSIEDSWPEVPIEENYAPVNVGQIKAIAKPFYDRLIEAGYDTRQNLIDRGYPFDWEFDYPWDPESPVGENYALANVGQLKIVFSFDVTGFSHGDDPAENPLPEWWRLEYFDEIGIEPDVDYDGDGRTNLEEYLAETNPTNPDNPDVALQLFTTFPN